MRLTDNLRGTILRAILINRLQEDYSQICAEAALLANDIYFKYIPDFIRELPAGVCPTESHIHFQSGGTTYGVHFNGEFDLRHPDTHERFYHWFENTPTVSQPVPYNKKGSVLAIFEPTEAKGSFYQRSEFLQHKYADFQKKFFDLHKQIKSVLATFTTVEKLLDAWPESRPFIPPEKAPVQLPALPISELNQMLRLP